jgi:hypothetical protein
VKNSGEFVKANKKIVLQFEQLKNYLFKRQKPEAKSQNESRCIAEDYFPYYA